MSTASAPSPVPAPAPAPVNENLMNAVESFRKALTPEMAKRPNGLEILDGAVRTVLGQKSGDAPGHPEEASIVEALQNMLKMIGLLPQARAPNAHGDQISPQPPPPSAPQPQPQSYQQANHSGTQGSASQPQPPTKSTGSEKPNPTIMRPMFTQNQNRPSGTSIPRPPMNNMGRSNSSSSNAPMRQQTPLGSPAPQANPSNVASAPIAAIETGQVEGPKKEVVDEPVQVKSEPAAGLSTPGPQAAETK